MTRHNTPTSKGQITMTNSEMTAEELDDLQYRRRLQRFGAYLLRDDREEFERKQEESRRAHEEYLDTAPST